MITLTDIRKSYALPAMTVEVLKGISLNVAAGEFVAIMGPSGSGKSTLMNMIGCLDRPTSGTYLFGGEPVSAKTDDELAEIRNRKIGFVFQSFNLLPRMPAWKNVELPLIYSGVPAKERKDRSMALLERVGLMTRAAHGPNELSGGEQQRVAIARALVNRPSLILADEPTGNLDSHAGAEIMSLMEELNREGVTIVMVTHELAIGKRAGRIVRIMDGLVDTGGKAR